jgi:hypothetical protein
MVAAAATLKAEALKTWVLSFSDLPRPCSGLWVRDSLTVGVCDAPVFGESAMLTSPVVIA